MGFHTIRFSAYMEWISDIWNIVEAVEASVEAVDAVFTHLRGTLGRTPLSVMLPSLPDGHNLHWN